MVAEGRRLLILACSRGKRPDVGLLPALERYDGPAFRILRRYLRTAPANPPDVCVLSAEFGLIAAGTPIPVYDRQMTPARAEELRPAVHEGLSALLDPAPASIFVCAGALYRRALADIALLTDAPTSVTIATGARGRQLAALRDWLHGEPPPLDGHASRGPVSRGTPPGVRTDPPRLRGRIVDLTAASVLRS